jgi:hypothetical protein
VACGTFQYLSLLTHPCLSMGLAFLMSQPVILIIVATLNGHSRFRQAFSIACSCLTPIASLWRHKTVILSKYGLLLTRHNGGKDEFDHGTLHQPRHMTQRRIPLIEPAPCQPPPVSVVRYKRF